MANPEHSEHRHLVEWYGRPFDPNDLDLFNLRLHLGALAKRRHAGKLAYAKSRVKN